MLSTVKEKIYSAVQDGIEANSSVLRIISENRHSKKVAESESFPEPDVNHEAGARLLAKYQTEWKLLHEEAEQNALSADNVDMFMTRIYLNVTDQLNNIITINNALANFPQISRTLDNCLSQAKEIRSLCERVENDLIHLEDLKERCDLKRRQEEHRLQLSMYKEKKFNEFETNRISLAKQKAGAARKIEIQQRNELLEKQRIAEKAFLEDITLFKATGIVPKSDGDGAKEKTTLEDIQLHNQDTTELDHFLDED